MSGFAPALFLFVVVLVVVFALLSTLGFDERTTPVGPLGKVRSSTNPESRVLGNMDSYIGLGKDCARCTVILWTVGMGGDWFDAVDVDAGVCIVDGVSTLLVKGPVKAMLEVGSGEDSDVVSPPARVSPKGCRTSRSLRK